MANDFAGNPWFVDTAGASALAKTDHSPVWVLGFTFTGYTTGAADQAVLKFRGNAHTLVIQGDANKDAVHVMFGERTAVRDIVVSTLTSGNLLVWLAV